MEVPGLGEVPTTWILVAGGVTLFYFYGKWRNRLLKDLGIPGPEPTIYVGNLIQIIKQGVDFDDPVGKKYGKVTGAYLGGRPMISVADPDIIREILIKQFPNFIDRPSPTLNDYPINKGILFEHGETWRRVRNIVSPTFSGAKLRQMCDKVNACSRTLEAHLLKAAKSDAAIDIRDYFGYFSMDVISTTAFGIEIDSYNNSNSVLINEARKIFSGASIANPALAVTMIFPGLEPVFRLLGFSMFPRSPVKFLAKVLTEMIEQRRGDKEKRRDFLQLLIDAEDSGFKNKKMSHDEVLGQALMFFIAGYETTAHTLHFTAYSLATNPDVQQRLIDEIDTVLGDRDPDYDNISELPYLENVITETLRMYPVVPVLTRETVETVKIKGYTFPKGCGVAVPSIIIHRDPEIYPEPHRFNPDRWDRKSEMDPMTYLPFGHGPRHCIGMRLAQVEMKMALAHILKKIMFVPAPDTPKVLKGSDLEILSLLSLKKKIMLKIKAR